MKTIEAKVLDSRHLELAEAIPARAGERIQISVGEPDDTDPVWLEAARRGFLDAYDDADRIYDDA